MKKVQKNGRYTAREMYGCRGFVAHHNTDIHGDTAPQDTIVKYEGIAKRLQLKKGESKKLF